MKKLVWICILFTCLVGCTKENERARTRIAVKNTVSIISAVKMNYILDQTSIKIGEPYDIMTLTNMKINVTSGTYTILSETAQSDESQIRLNQVVIDDHTCTGTKDSMECIRN